MKALSDLKRGDKVIMISPSRIERPMVVVRTTKHNVYCAFNLNSGGYPFDKKTGRRIGFWEEGIRLRTVEDDRREAVTKERGQLLDEIQEWVEKKPWARWNLDQLQELVDVFLRLEERNDNA